MKKFIKTRNLIYLILFINLTLTLYSKDNLHTYKLNLIIDKDSLLEINSNEFDVSSFEITGNINYQSEKGFVFITLIDDNKNEYLILNEYKIYSEGAYIEFNNYNKEKEFINKIKPKYIKIRIKDATLNFQSFKFEKFNQLVKLKTVFKVDNDSIELKKVLKYIKKYKLNWKAGFTSISNLNYESKKKIFGESYTNTFGIEYYKGGIFEIPNIENKIGSNLSDNSNSTLTISQTSSIQQIDSGYVNEFDWRKRHGKNWMTIPKNQSPCNSCTVFGYIGALEASINLYLNEIRNYDLSEQEIISCIPPYPYFAPFPPYYTEPAGQNCSNGFSEWRIGDYLVQNGAINEECLPQSDSVYYRYQPTCNEKCITPNYNIKISDYLYIIPKNQLNINWNSEVIKRWLIKYGPMPVAIKDISTIPHMMVLVGYKVDPLDGKNIWYFKNSWGADWGENGYYSVKNNKSDWNPFLLGYSTAIKMPLISTNFNESNVICSDNDGDGYYFWGLGPKPSTCPVCSYSVPDGDDTDPTKGPIDEKGNFLPFQAITTLKSGIYYNNIYPLNMNITTPTLVCGDIYISNANLNIYSRLDIQDGSKIILGAASNLFLRNDAVLSNVSSLEIMYGGNVHIISQAARIEQKSNSVLDVKIGGQFKIETGEYK